MDDERNEDHHRIKCEEVKVAMAAVEAARQEGCTEASALGEEVEALIDLIQPSLKENVLSVDNAGHQLGLVDLMCEVGEFCLHAGHFDICRYEGFTPIYVALRDFFSDFFIPFVESIQESNQDKGMDSDWMHSIERMIQVETEPKGDDKQVQFAQMSAQFRAVRLEGNRARLALEHAMFVKWLQARNMAGVYDQFKMSLTALHEAGEHYGTDGGDIEEANKFMERRDWNEDWNSG